MKKLLSEFIALDGFDGLYCAVKGPLRCTAIRLRTGGLCLFSPVQGLTEKAVASLRGMGEVEILLAPNHYHHKGLREYAEAFPKALICASAGAASRLEGITQLRFESLDALRALLRDGTKLVVPAGLKTGEVWICASGSNRSRAWIVVDAFCGPNDSEEIAAEPCILGTFPRFGVADRSTYFEWLERQLEPDNPKAIVPCHGAVVRSQKLSSVIRELVSNHFES
jgi:hypothetical protein